MNKPGEFKYCLALDCETSGLSKYSFDPSIVKTTNKTYQIVSIGLIIVEVETLKEIEELYLEIKWNGESVWLKEAEKVHGLSKEYLQENGLDESDATYLIGEFILKYFDVNYTIPLLGHNVVAFDRYFLYNLFKKYDIELNFGNRHIDTFSLGCGILNLYNSNALFSKMGIKRDDIHNSLEDARYAIEVVRNMRTLWEAFIEPNL